MKNRITATLLALLLGGIGAHKFYLGKTTWGFVYLLTCWTFIPAFLGLVEGIRYLVMDEADFQNQYGCETTLVMTSEGIATPQTHVRCPDCRELVRKDARKCKHCGTHLIPQP